MQYLLHNVRCNTLHVSYNTTVHLLSRDLTLLANIVNCNNIVSSSNVGLLPLWHIYYMTLHVSHIIQSVIFISYCCHVSPSYVLYNVLYSICTIFFESLSFFPYNDNFLLLFPDIIFFSYQNLILTLRRSLQSSVSLSTYCYLSSSLL